jgi:hypothetical protein
VPSKSPQADFGENELHTQFVEFQATWRHGRTPGKKVGEFIHVFVFSADILVVLQGELKIKNPPYGGFLRL